MKITICGSMQFHKEMREIRAILIAMGHEVLVPEDLDDPQVHESSFVSDEEKITAKIEHDFIREHFRKIQNAEAILVLNYDKKDIKNYIGGNTFLEMGYAFGLGKKMYLFNPIPAMDYLTEMHAMKPTVLDGDLSKI